jgi:hypothetical protein
MASAKERSPLNVACSAMEHSSASWNASLIPCAVIGSLV